MNITTWILVAIVLLLFPLIVILSKQRRVDCVQIGVMLLGLGIIVMVGFMVFEQIKPVLVNQTIIQVRTNPTIIPTQVTTPIITTTTSTTLNMEDVWNKRLTEYYSGSTS
jgi:uncharacterized membrane protein YGL010W